MHLLGVTNGFGSLLASGRTDRPRGAAVLLGEVGALVAVAGSLLPWGTGDCYSRDHGLAMLPLVLVGAGLLAVPHLKGAEGVPFRLTALGAMLCGIVVTVFVGHDISDVSRIPTDCIQDPPVGVSLRGSPAVGLYVTLAGAVLLALGALATALARPRPRV